MDDDAPLSALAKAPKFDDDTPLASLAGPKTAPKAGGSPSGAKVPPKGSPKAVIGKGKGKGKGTPTKRKSGGSSSSSSDSSSDGSSSSDSDGKPIAGKRKGPGKTAANKKVKKPANVNTNDDNNEEAVDGGGAVTKRRRSAKEQAAADLLCRWWYALPDWPPQDAAYYEAELKRRSLRKVSIQEWEWVPEKDSSGRSKVYELSAFRGLFRNHLGDLVDCRPKETCPCYTNFMKKDLSELYDLLVVAVENQLIDLKKSTYNEATLEQELRVKLTSFRDKAYQAKQLKGKVKIN